MPLNEQGVAVLVILFLAWLQNISFTIVSRSRNRNNFWYHLIAACGSNTIWFLTFRQLVLADMTFTLLVPYTIGTVAGSLSGQWISMRIEQAIGAKADAKEKEEFVEIDVVTGVVVDTQGNLRSYIKTLKLPKGAIIPYKSKRLPPPPPKPPRK